MTYSVHHRLVSHSDLKHGSTQDMTGIVCLNLQVLAHLGVRVCVCVCVYVCVRVWHTPQRNIYQTDFFTHFDRLVKVDSDYFPHAIFDHLRSEKVHLSFLLYSYLPIVFLKRENILVNTFPQGGCLQREGRERFYQGGKPPPPKYEVSLTQQWPSYQEDRAYCFSGMCHVNRSIVTTHLCEIGEGPAVIQVEMTGKRKSLTPLVRGAGRCPKPYDETVNVFCQRTPRLSDIGEIREPPLQIAIVKS